jgi:hypothetical protein
VACFPFARLKHGLGQIPYLKSEHIGGGGVSMCVSLKIIDQMDLESFTCLVSCIFSNSIMKMEKIENNVPTPQEVSFYEHVLHNIIDLIDFKKISYIIKNDARSIIEENHPIYFESIEDFISDMMHGIINSEFEDVMKYDFLVDGEEPIMYPVFHLENEFPDDEEDQFEDDEFESSVAFSSEGDESGVVMTDHIRKAKSGQIIVSKKTIMGYVLEAKGKEVSYYLDESGKNLIIPKLLSLLKKSDSFPLDSWVEHVPGWYCRIVKAKS